MGRAQEGDAHKLASTNAVDATEVNIWCPLARGEFLDLLMRISSHSSFTDDGSLRPDRAAY